MSKITVITATHDRPEMLKRAIESVLSQTVEDFEYIIVDDNPSTKESKKVVESFEDKRIRYILNKDNPAKTHCKPFNIALKESKGEYIAYLDDDNEFYPYHLEVLLKALESNDVDVVYCDMMIVQPNGEMTQGIVKDFDPQFLLNRNFIDTSEMMHRREVAFNIGGWDEVVTRFTDWNFCVRAAKWGARFKRVPIIALRYYAHGGDTQSKRTETNSWYDPMYGMYMFEPVGWDPVGGYIFRDYLGENKGETKPRVAIFTLTYGRLDYTKKMFQSLKDSTDMDFDWYVFDQGSGDGTEEWLYELKQNEGQPRYIHLNGSNVGISKASNHLLDKIEATTVLLPKDYQIVIKVDNDAQFLTKGWLSTVKDLWKRNHMLYMSPYPEGLVNNPGGAPRVGYGYVGPYMTEVTEHIGGLCAAIDSHAYKDFRWNDQFKHGNQDWEASSFFRTVGYMPCYISIHRVYHQDTTVGQAKKYPEYFERRKIEKTEVA